MGWKHRVVNTDRKEEKGMRKEEMKWSEVRDTQNRGSRGGDSRIQSCALLPAPHFCLCCHLYPLNALLKPDHICCCKLLLRATLVEAEKGQNGGHSFTRAGF